KFALKALAVTGAAAIAAIGVSAFQAAQKLADFARMARDDEKAANALASSIRASTKATDEQIASVEQWIDTVQRATGVADDDLRPAYARLIRSTGSFEKAQRLLRIALDVSAASSKPLATVVEALGKAYDGNNVSLARLGLGYSKAQLKAMEFNDVQKDLEQRFSGAALDKADTYEGVMARFAITVDELKESLGYALLPYMKKLAEYGIQIADAFGRNGAAGAFAELKYILKTLLYDDQGMLNSAGQTLNELIGKLNFVISTINAISGVGKFVPSTFLLQRFTDIDLTPSFGRVDPLQTQINAGSLRGIRGGVNTGTTITVQTGIGDPVEIGRQVYNALQQFERRRGGR
ncbi:MAG: hypothetical protein ACO3DI_06560, partial [Ilumatobacteraceae bacterium]